MNLGYRVDLGGGGRRDLGTKRRSETTGTGEPGSIPTPLAEPGRPIPYGVGRFRVVRPNAIWYGNLRPIYEVTSEVETTGDEEYEPVSGGAVKTEEEIVTKTYKTIGYNLSMQFSICLGPGVVLRAMGVGEQTLWTGTAGPARTEITVASNETIISGKVIFSGGDFDQLPDPFLEEFIDPYQLPGYIGVAHIIIADLRVDQLGSAYPWFEVERFPNPLGLSSGDNRIGDDLNLASALADYVGSEWGGAGAGTDAIGTSFATAAATLANEGNAVSLQLDQENTAADIIKLLSIQADGIVYEDPDTGLVEFKLFRRASIDPLNVAKLTSTNSSRIGRFERDAWPATRNKLRVTYTRRDKGYERDSILGYTFNAINDRFKANRSATIDFPICNTTDLAKTLLARELGKAGVPLSAGEVETTRTGGVGDLLPGDPVQVLMADRVQPITGFATRVRRFGLSENRLIVSFLEYPSQNANVVFDAETGLGDALTIGPVKPTAVVIKQAPIFLARRAVGTSTTVTNTLLRAIVLPTPDSHLQASFHAFVSNRPGAGGLVGVVRASDYPTVGKLESAMGQFDDMDDGTISSIDVADVINPIFMQSEGATGVTEGRLFMMIDDEILSFEGASENLDGSWTLTNVHRALLDTAPQAHAANASVFIIGSNFSMISSGFKYPSAYVPQWRITSNTAFAEGNPETDYVATTSFDMTFNRLILPPRPHDTKIEGAARSTSLTNVFGEVGLILSPGEEIDVTWRTRSRNALTVSKQTDAAEDSELDPYGDYQLHRVMIRDSGGTLRDCGATADDGNYNALTVNVHASTALGRGNLFVRAETVYGNSKYEDQVPVFIMATDYFVDEDEDFYFVGENGTDLYVMES